MKLLPTFFAFVFILLSLSTPAHARAPEESEFSAAAILADDISEWIAEEKRRPRSLGIFFIHSNYPFDQDFSTIMEAEILKGLSQRGITKVSSCAECRAPQVNVSEDKVVVTKGAPDSETMKQIGKKYPVESFLMVEIYRTKLTVMAHASLYSNPEGTILGAERFSVPAINLTDSSVQVLFTFGSGKVLSGSTPSVVTANSSLVFAGNLLLLEEIGFGKAGLNLGAVLGSPSALLYINPTLSFRGRFGHSYLGYAFNLGAGYGVASGSKGFTLRAAYEIMLGSLAVVGFEGTYFLPSSTGTDSLQSYIGAHIGLSFGH